MAALMFGEFRLDTVKQAALAGRAAGRAQRNPLGGAEPPRRAQHGRRPGRWVSGDQARAARSVLARRAGQRGNAAQLHERNPQALGDDPQQPRYIKTQNREGWRFVMKVTSSQAKTSMLDRLPQPHGGEYDPSWYVERPPRGTRYSGLHPIPRSPRRGLRPAGLRQVDADQPCAGSCM